MTWKATYAPADNWVKCRYCRATAAHVRELHHTLDCWRSWPQCPVCGARAMFVSRIRHHYTCTRQE